MDDQHLDGGAPETAISGDASAGIARPTRHDTMNLATLFRWLSAIFFVSAVIAIVTLLVSDALNQLRFTSVHRRAGALAFMLIGSSYIGLQLSSRRWKERSKELLLGLAFLLWGTEQFLPANSLATAMDTAVVLIFVVDLSLIIVERLRQRNHE
jgi:hypothetical protein